MAQGHSNWSMKPISVELRPLASGEPSPRFPSEDLNIRSWDHKSASYDGKKEREREGGDPMGDRPKI